MPALVTYVRYSTGETDLKAILAKKIPKEQERVKNFRKQHGSTKVGEVTVDMVSFNFNQLINSNKDRVMKGHACSLIDESAYNFF